MKTLISLGLAILIVFSTRVNAEQATAPIGFVQLCERQPELVMCNVSTETKHIGSIDQLKSINFQVNRSMRYVDDVPANGSLDLWQVPVNNEGDCEDYALLKYKMLVESGWNPNDLSFAILRTLGTRGGYHAILVATVEGKKYSLDMNFNEVKEVGRIYGGGMRWESIQISGTTNFRKFDGTY